MKIKILSFGKFKNSQAYEQIFNYYTKRIDVNIELIELKTHNISKKLELEKKEIIKHINKGDFVICLDKIGKNIDSEEFSKEIFKIFSSGYKTIIFLIGSESGFHNEIKTLYETFSFGRQTWPHLLTRVMLIEQIYRAFEIKKNSNYHK
jgi:23S rRNA (pseudouridine1915-N3)-methyltransferase